VSANVETKNLRCNARGFLGRFGQLHPAGLASPTGVHLRLDDDRATKFLRDSGSFFGGFRDTPAVRWDAARRKDF
jgi:hypothetical protein